MSAQGGRNGILSLTIKDKAVLYSAYMPYLQHGGLFVPTNKPYNIGDEVFMLLNLMDEPDKIPIAGKVVWVTSRGAQGNRTAGIGVQFSEEDATANIKIENHLAGSLQSDRPPHTLCSDAFASPSAWLLMFSSQRMGSPNGLYEITAKKWAPKRSPLRPLGVKHKEIVSLGALRMLQRAPV